MNINCLKQFTMKKTIFFSIISVLFISFVFKVNAQTPSIKWWYDVNDASFGQSAAGDIDGDGFLEVVFGCYRNDSSIYALNANDGTLLWKYNAHTLYAEGCNDVAPIIFDFEDDGLVEVVVPSSCNPKTFCFNGATGTVKWQINTRGSDSPPVIADVDNDGMYEILHGEFGGYVKCINAENGSEAWNLPVDLNSWIQTAPTIVDLDNNGQLDFVVGTWNFNDLDSVYAFRGDNQQKLWAYPIHDVMYHGTAVADLDNDGKPELVIGSYNDTLYCINGENGTTKWKYKANGGYIGSPATIADIDNDGSCEVVFVSAYKVIALSNNGIEKWTYNIPGYEQSFRGVAIADINNDDYLDIIFGTNGGKVIALNGNNGSLIWSLDLAAHYGNVNFEIDHAPLVADFDHDDTLEIFIVGGHAEYPAFSNNFGRAYMIKAGIGKGPDWLMFQNDIRRQSSLCPFVPSSINEVQEPTIFSVYPNPASSEITLNYDFQDIAQIQIFNILGQIVYESSSIQTQHIDIHYFNSGLYCVYVKNIKNEIFLSKFVKL